MIGIALVYVSAVNNTISILIILFCLIIAILCSQADSAGWAEIAAHTLNASWRNSKAKPRTRDEATWYLTRWHAPSRWHRAIVGQRSLARLECRCVLHSAPDCRQCGVVQPTTNRPHGSRLAARASANEGCVRGTHGRPTARRENRPSTVGGPPPPPPLRA